MSNFEARLAAAEDRIRAETAAAIAEANAALSVSGRVDCVECGCTIPAARRLVYPSATRCLECQQTAEMEALPK